MRTHTTHRSQGTARTLRTPGEGTNPRSASRRARKTLSVLEGALLLLCAVALIAALVMSTGRVAHGSANSRMIRVEPGQTLWDLARTHRIEGHSTAQTVDAIRAMNDMKGSDLVAGDTVLVPADELPDTALAAR